MRTEKPSHVREETPRGASSGTRWSEVEAAGTPWTPRGGEALERQLRRSRPLLVAHVRARHGLALPEAEDLVHSFVHQRILLHNLYAEAKRGRGRFRSYLLRALDHFISSELRRQRSKHRSPGAPFLPLSELREELHPAIEDPADEEEFPWRNVVIAGALLDMRTKCLRNGREDLWRVYLERLLLPAAEGAAPLSYEAMIQDYQLASPSQAFSLLNTAKRVFDRHYNRVLEAFRRQHPDALEILGRLRKKSGSPRRSHPNLDPRTNAPASLSRSPSQPA